MKSEHPPHQVGDTFFLLKVLYLFLLSSFKLPVFFLRFFPPNLQHVLRSTGLSHHPPRATDGRTDLRRQSHTLAETSEHQEAPQKRRTCTDHNDDHVAEQHAHRRDYRAHDGHVLDVPYRQHRLPQRRLPHRFPHGCHCFPRKRPRELQHRLQ